jgi:hypothetical protein
LLEEFKTTLQDERTDPLIVESIIEGLGQGQKRDLQDTNEQTQIGWASILEGCFGIFWMEQQERYLQQNSIERSSKKWSEMIVRKIWKIAW